MGGRIRFVNEERAAGWPPDWRGDGASLLWRYNLHYFDWLWALNYEEARQAAADWIARHPCTPANVGWQPYPASLRIMNWIGVFFGRFRDATEADVEWRALLCPSLWRQCEWLSRNLETHLLGNHYLENGAALALAGSVFAGPHADRWLRLGSGIVAQQMAEQVLPDGMQFERSPMYHLRATWLAMTLAECGRGEARRAAAERLPQMAAALKLLTHGDGGIALLNDSALDVYHNPSDILQACGDSGPVPGPWQLPQAGYYGYRDKRISLVIDAAPIGPDYIPGHAHADIFTFEMCVSGFRAIVDAGIASYAPGAARDWCRSTAAHNTLEIEGVDQCEMWGAFRVGRRGRPHDVVFRADASGAFELSAWHDGYMRLAGRPRHHRTWRWQTDGVLEIVDRIEAATLMHGVARIHFGPGCRLRVVGAGRAEVLWKGGRLHISTAPAKPMRIEETKTFPRFGVPEANRCLAIPLRSDEPELRTRIEAL